MCRVKLLSLLVAVGFILLISGCDDLATTTAVMTAPITTTASGTPVSTAPATATTTGQTTSAGQTTVAAGTTSASPTTTSITLTTVTTPTTTLPPTTTDSLSTLTTTIATTTATEAVDSLPIADVDDLLAFIADGNPTGNYHLSADIDLTGVSLTGSTMVFAGIFDGRGHTISNAVVNASGNKMGFLFKELSRDGVIRNVIFANSVHNGGGTSEASAFVSAFAKGGATFENLFFRNVSVIHPGSYAALLFGDVVSESLNPDDKIIIRDITVINNEGSKVQGGDYIGGLVGAARKFVRIEMENIYFQSEVRSTGSQTTGILMGRDNSANVSLMVNNVVIKGSLTAAKDAGVILGRSSAGTVVTATNVFISDFTLSSGNSAMNIGIGNMASGTVKTLSHVYYNNASTSFLIGGNPGIPTDGTPLAPEAITTSWFEDSGFDKLFFRLGGATIMRNLDDGGELVATGISLVTTTIKKTYLVGEPLELENLKVYLNNSDGSSNLLADTQYTLDIGQYNSDAIGNYVITVAYDIWEIGFTVSVIEVTSLVVDTLLFQDTYLIGTALSLSGIAVKALLSDNSLLWLMSSDYEVDTSAFVATVPGTYQLHFTYRDLPAVSINVHVVASDAIVTENQIFLTVDHEYAGPVGAYVESAYAFATVKSAFQHLANLALPSDIEKIVHVRAGTYYEKVTLAVPNVRLVGESRDTTIITYDAASGQPNPTGGTWGTQGSATVAIKSAATNFLAANITFANGFDYLQANIADKQAVALVTEADRVIFYNCAFLGYQDTLYAKSGRQYYRNVYVEGVVDFIFGNGGPAYFEDSTIKSLYRPVSGGAIATNKGFATQESALLAIGYVFYHNELIADSGVAEGTIFLGRPWGANAAIAYIDNTFGAHIATAGWTEMSGNLPENARFHEYQNRNTDGAILPVTTKGQPLSETQAATFIDKDTVFAQINGAHDFGSEWNHASDYALIVALAETP